MSSRLKAVLNGANAFLERRMYLVVLGGMLLGWVFPSLACFKSLVPFLFGYMTLVTALSISWRGIAGVITLPGPVMLVLLLLHVMMPALSLSLTSLTLGYGTPFAVGMVLAMLIPIGVVSVIWTGLAKGESPLALTAVTLDSLLCPVILPASVWFFLGRSVSFDSRSLIVGLLWMIVLPTACGVSLHDFSRGRLGPWSSPVNGPLSKMCLSLVVAVNMAAAHGIIAGLGRSILPLLGLLVVQAVLGFLVGYGAGRALGYQPARVRTVTFCVGIRNISAGIVIALRYFSAAAAVPVVLAMLFQQPLASLFHRWLSRTGDSTLGTHGFPEGTGPSMEN